MCDKVRTGNTLEKMEEKDGERTHGNISSDLEPVWKREKTGGKKMSTVATSKKLHWEIMGFNTFCPPVR